VPLPANSSGHPIIYFIVNFFSSADFGLNLKRKDVINKPF